MCVPSDLAFRLCYKDGCLHRSLLIRDFNPLKMGFARWDPLAYYLIVFLLFTSVTFLVHVCELETIKSRKESNETKFDTIYINEFLDVVFEDCPI